MLLPGEALAALCRAAGSLRTSTRIEIGRARATYLQDERSHRRAAEEEEEEKEEKGELGEKEEGRRTRGFNVGQLLLNDPPALRSGG